MKIFVAERNGNTQGIFVDIESARNVVVCTLSDGSGVHPDQVGEYELVGNEFKFVDWHDGK